MIVLWGVVIFLILRLVWLLIVRAAPQVPPAHFGVVKSIFGGRAGRVIHESKNITDAIKKKNLIWPILESVDVVSYGLDAKEINTSFVSRDRISILNNGSLNWRPNWRITDRQGRIRFVEMQESVIVDGIADAIKSELGKIAGVKEFGVFVEEREALEALINSLLKLDTPPHLDPGVLRSVDDRYVVGLNATEIGDLKGSLPASSPPPKQWLEFYGKFSHLVRAALEEVGNDPERTSPIENRYGIEIIAFVLSEVDFDKETKDALQAQKRAEAEMKGAEAVTERVSQIAERLKREHPGITDKEALDAALVLTGKANATVFSGLQNSNPLINVSGRQ